jgi:hypothetical protein
VGALACFFVLSPALFTPWSFGPDYTNHIWLVWQQAVAIADHGHPTLYLQTPSGILEPYYGFYGGTLYATAGAVAALVGTDHTYAVYVASIGAATAFAYGGTWWLGRLLGLSRWVSHLPAFVLVTSAYYLTDAYARGAWPELVALSAVPMVLAGGAHLLTRPWGPGPVALFVIGVVVMTGSHNLTLFWSAVIIGPVAVIALVLAGRERPSLRRIAAVAALGALALAVNAWFLVLDLTHSTDVQAWIQNKMFIEQHFSHYFYFDNLGVVLDPLRGTPSQSTTFGLAIAPPIVAFALSVALAGLAWPTLNGARRWARRLWLLLFAVMATLVVLLVMPAGWWLAIGSPFVNIQFPYRLAGWLLIAVVVQLAISLRFARGMSPVRRRTAVILSLAVIAATIAQAAAQMYPAARVDNRLYRDFNPLMYPMDKQAGSKPRELAFVGGPTTPPRTFYDPFSYADASLPVIETEPRRTLIFPRPEPGQTSASLSGPMPPGRGPIATNIGAGPYAVEVHGLPVIGRTPGGALVLEPPAAGPRVRRVTVTADAGVAETVGVAVSAFCLLGVLGLLVALTVRSTLRYRRARN